MSEHSHNATNISAVMLDDGLKAAVRLACYRRRLPKDELSAMLDTASGSA